jgi:hypothetical protein
VAIERINFFRRYGRALIGILSFDLQFATPHWNGFALAKSVLPVDALPTGAHQSVTFGPSPEPPIQPGSLEPIEATSCSLCVRYHLKNQQLDR